MRRLPLSLLPLAIYGALSLLFAGNPIAASAPVAAAQFWSRTAFSLDAVSGASIAVSFGGLLCGAAVAIVVFIAWRTVSAGSARLSDSIFATIAFGLHVIILMAIPAAATLTFLSLTFIALMAALVHTLLGMALHTSRTDAR